MAAIIIEWVLYCLWLFRTGLGCDLCSFHLLQHLIFQRLVCVCVVFVLDDFLRWQCAEQCQIFYYVGSGARKGGRRDGDLKSFIYIELL